MPSITIVTRAGDELPLEADIGLSIMEAIRNGGVDELMALCGGCCSCATCHVFVDNDHLAATGPMSEDENDLLDSSEHRSEHSRLSCQITMVADLAGMRVTIAPED